MKPISCLVAVLVVLISALAVQGQPNEPPKEFTNSLGMKFVWIPPGTFMMGSPKEEKGRNEDEIQHKVTLTKGFYLGVYLVAQEEWEAVMDTNPSVHKHEKNLPVERVNWENCQEFLKRIGKKDGHTYRLPTEAEWEYSCRAGSKGAYFFGEDRKLLGQYAWYEENSERKTHPVGQKKPNEWGLYDMHGNVWEWCADWLGEYPKSDVVDPKGPDAGIRRVVRGGSYFSNASNVRSADRRYPMPMAYLSYFGFRVAMTFTP